MFFNPEYVTRSDEDDRRLKRDAAGSDARDAAGSDARDLDASRTNRLEFCNSHDVCRV